METQILLHTDRLNQKFALLEQKLTKAGDQLDILKQEEEALSKFWHGSAKEAWEAEFQKKLDALAQAIKESAASIAKLKERAGELVQYEQSVYEIIASLRS